MGFEITINVDDRLVRERMLRVGRRVAAQRIRRAGELAHAKALASAQAQIHVRAPERRTVKGAHYVNAFRPVQYHGLSAVEGGAPLSFEISNSHQFARLIEHGNPGGYEIRPKRGSRGGKKQGRLVFPAGAHWLPGPPWVTLAPGQSVTHSGSKPYKIMENAVKEAMRSSFGVSGRKVR